VPDAPPSASNGETAAKRQSDVPLPEERTGTRALKVLLQAGAAAGALLSISGVVFGFVHAVGLGDGGGGGGQAVKATTGPVRLSVPRRSVRHMTFREWMIDNKIDPRYQPPDQFNERGVMVDYELEAPGYKAGSEFPVYFRLHRRTGADRYAFVEQFEDSAKLEVDSESCTCASTFIRIPRAKGRYRIEIQVFRPGRKTHSPLKGGKAYTELFRGLG